MPAFRAAIYLDRDGTVIEEKHYLSRPDQVALTPRAAEAVRRMNAAGLATVLVTNQAGVARGYFSEADVAAVHAHLSQLLALEGACLDGIFYCPHHPEGALPALRQTCRCRKPGPGLVEAARAQLGLSGLPEVVIGDKALDLALARGVGAWAILVRTGYGPKTELEVCDTAEAADVVVDNLWEAVDWILLKLAADAGDEGERGPEGR